MKSLIIIVLSLLFTAGTMYGQTNQPPPVPYEEQPEVQTRGPVNEAFAQPVAIEENEGYIVPKAPPVDIEETLPAKRPVGEQFAWIPGYWAWDSERDDHIWISGCWRAVPPGKYWNPGYWAKVQGGYRWVAGFWAPVSNAEVEYLPPPPAVTYIEPAGADRPDMIWVPACWYWSNGRYTLRSGYWIQAREDWVWVPSHYLWTPRGHVFVSGHWDYPLLHRGVLFAPVYFRGNLYGRHRLSYSLSIVLDLGNLEFGLFTRPGYRHYYFGDYYDNFYIGIGIFPWFESVTRRTWYDPIYLHNRWSHRRHDRDWWKHERREYERRRADRDLRPPRTYHEMERRVKNMAESRKKNYEVAAPMNRIIERKATTFKYRQIKPEDRRQISRHSEDLQKNIRERSQREALENSIRNDRPVRVNTRTQKPIERQAPINRPGTDINKIERPEMRTPVEGNNSDENNSRRSVTSYPRPVRSEEVRGERSTTPSTQGNVKESVQRKDRQVKPDNVRTPAPQVYDRFKEELKKKQASSDQGEIEVKQERKARPRIDKIKR
ncbi:MAG: YXWGXW repeat-containing protein [Deltaproteobacteria bacterium]|nr:YXWGXW repeat-containing protein [Deltaproteobacteria bacterium]